MPRHPTFPCLRSTLARNRRGNDPFQKNIQVNNFEVTICYFHPLSVPSNPQELLLFSFVTSPTCFKVWLLMFCYSAHISVAECKEDCLAPVNLLFLCICRLLDIHHVDAKNTCPHLNAVKSNKARMWGLDVSFHNRKEGDILAKTWSVSMKQISCSCLLDFLYVIGSLEKVKSKVFLIRQWLW